MGTMERIQQAWSDMGYPRVRRSLAQLSLAFFTLVYFFVSMAAEPEWRAAFVGLSLCYLAAFLSVGSEWFWGRWFASGLGWSGMMVGVFSLVTVGWVPALVFYAAMHGLVVLGLRGKQVAALYEGKDGWRARYDLDDYGAARLGKTITRASASLPALVIWALGPKDPGSDSLLLSVSTSAAWLIVPALVALGLFLLVRMRSAGVLVLAAGAAIGLMGTLVTRPFVASHYTQPLAGDLWDVGPVGVFGLAVLVWAIAPFARPVVRMLRGR